MAGDSNHGNLTRAPPYCTTGSTTPGSVNSVWSAAWSRTWWTSELTNPHAVYTFLIRWWPLHADVYVGGPS